MRPATPFLAAISLVAGSALAVAPAPEPVQAADNACAELATTGSCFLTWDEYGEASIDFTVPESVGTITVLVAGGSGGDAGGDAAPGGTGTLLVTTLDTSAGRDFTVWLGDDGNGTRDGWSSGGAGAQAPGDFHDGGGGGGSTAIALTAEGHDNPLMVAGGGGGGGGAVSIQNGAADGGGIGGQGGSWGVAGGPGHKDNASNGTGGTQNGASGNDGQAAVSAGTGVTAAGGGGGGGGWSNGGGAGESGGIGSCNALGFCPPDAAPGAGGGGAAGNSTWVGDIASPYVFAAPRGQGFVHVYAGTPEFLECQASNDPRFWIVPSGIQRVGVLAVGGQGQVGSNDTNSEGTGGLVSGMIDVTGISQLEYLVGCSGDSGGYGFGQPGAQGDASDFWNMQGGAGGGATLLSNGDDQGTEVFFGAGGGGGAGGNANCGGDLCDDTGGTGGSSGGMDGSFLPYNGEDGEGILDGPSGGCAACQATPDGAPGDSAAGGAGGGGGGAGYPSGGGAGHAASAKAGGGGGAGASYVGPTVANAILGASGWQDDGFIMLIPLGTVLNTLTVSMEVAGAAAQYAVGPYSLNVSCTLDGTVTNTATFQLGTTGSHDVNGIPTGASCTVTQTSSGQASDPAAPVTTTIVEGPNEVTLTNGYDTAGLEVSLDSTTDPADTGTQFDLTSQFIQVTCTFEGEHVQLPPPAQGGGLLTFDGEATWNGTSQTVQAPVGASCAFEQDATMGAPNITYSPSSTVVVEADGSSVAITDEYLLRTVTVTKQQGGQGEAPVDTDFPISIECQYNDQVILPVFQVSVPIGGSGQFHGVPQGSSCRVTEDNAHGATAVQYSNRDFIVTEDLQPITITNIYQAGDLHIVVSNTGAGASYANLPYEVDLVCTLNDAPLIDETIQVPAEGGIITRGVDPGAECTVTELSGNGAGSVTQPAGPITMPLDGSAVGVEIVNTFSVFPLSVTSENQGAGAPYANAAPVVSIQDCTFNGLPTGFSATVTMPVQGGTQIVPGVLENMQCTATYAVGPGGSANWEVLNGFPWSAVAGGIQFTMGPIFSPPTTVYVTNTFELGAVTVTKTVEGDGAYAANVPYRVEVQCTFNDLPVHRLGPDGIATLDFETDGTLIPGHGATQLETLVAGTACSAVETESGGATTVAYTPAGDGRSGAVEAPGAITVTNTFDAASLTVTKVLEGNNTEPYDSVEFPFDQACTFNGQYLAPPHRPSSFSIMGGQTEVFEQLPVGAVCHVREMQDWHATRVEPGVTQTVTLGVDDADLVFTNVFDSTTVTLRKELTGEGAETYGLPRTFTPQLRCTYPDGSRVILPGAGFVTLDASNSFTDTIEVPSEVECAVAQDNAAHATLVTFPEQQTVTADSPPELTVTSRFDLADIAVSKSAYGQFPASTEFGFAAECVWPGEEADPLPLNQPDQSEFELRSGQAKPLQALAGSVCTVTEVESEGALRVVVSASGPDTSASGAAATAHLWPADDVAFVFENFMIGSLPVTGAELRLGAIVLVGLLLGGLGVAAFAIGRRRAAR